MAASDILARIIKNMAGISAEARDPRDMDFSVFEAEHCFSSGAQPGFKAQGMATAAASLQDERILEISDALGMCLLMFKFDGKLFIVGPFVESAWSDDLGSSLLAANNLQASLMTPFKLYSCRYRIALRRDAVQVIISGIEALAPESRPYQKQSAHGCMLPVCGHEQGTVEAIVERYEMENELIRQVQAGDIHAAAKALERIEKRESHSSYMTRDLKSMIGGITVLRTLFRKATESAGVHPAIVDAIADAYAQKTYSLQNREDIESLIPGMLAEFCEAARQVAIKGYSHRIRDAVAFIQLKYSASLTLAEIAKHVFVSPNHLSHQFKAETGMSVTEFILKTRCEKAAELLKRTKLSVAEIGAYVGYLDNNYFVKVFKKCYGIVPTAFRDGK
ncbi:MAG: AraC family transcriptional regulator [Clostridiales bacterium]|jgi:AraC-like DNA-binding protein|nr:AraC family transcriptional regulator [Clostridiales bacterium]MDR2751167.1 AraC family transcriptional regulator [Clostridiales bacterium]